MSPPWPVVLLSYAWCCRHGVCRRQKPAPCRRSGAPVLSMPALLLLFHAATLVPLMRPMQPSWALTTPACRTCWSSPLCPSPPRPRWGGRHSAGTAAGAAASSAQRGCAQGCACTGVRSAPCPAAACCAHGCDQRPAQPAWHHHNMLPDACTPWTLQVDVAVTSGLNDVTLGGEVSYDAAKSAITKVCAGRPDSAISCPPYCIIKEACAATQDVASVSTAAL